jgi:hypothetical protein
MGFNCSVAFSDIDINCQLSSVGGIKEVVFLSQNNLDITFDANDETTVTEVDLNNEWFRLQHNQKDGTTVFTERKKTTGGLGIIDTSITVRVPRIDGKLNDLDYMSRREDIVAVMLHNNGTVTISGWMDGLTMDLNATSGNSIKDSSYIDVNLTCSSWIASLALPSTSVFVTNPFA